MSDMTKLKATNMLTKPISWKSDRFDIDDVKNANGHNESRIEAVCNGDDIFVKDSFDVAASLINKSSVYRLEIAVNSESGIDLWDDGRIILDYNFNTQHWSMDAYVGKRQWSFCSPKSVVNTIIAGLECTNRDGSVDAGVVKDIMKSLKDDREYIVNHSVLYKNESGEKFHDCEYMPEGSPELYDFALPINE